MTACETALCKRLQASRHQLQRDRVYCLCKLYNTMSGASSSALIMQTEIEQQILYVQSQPDELEQKPQMSRQVQVR